MSQIKSQSKGFTLIELLVVVGIIGALIGILVPVLAIARKRSNMMIEGTNLSSAVKALAVFADGNKTFYPGLTNTGKFSTASFTGQKYAAVANGSATNAATSINACNSYAYAVLMDEDAVAPKQLISTGETGSNTSTTALVILEATPEVSTSKASTDAASNGLISSELNSSYAVLAYGASTGLRAEWKATTSQQAPVMSTRLIFNDTLATAAADQYSCVWTDALSSKWEGSVVRNDTSVGREKFGTNNEIVDQFKNLKYGSVICPTGSNSSATAVALWGKAGTATSGTATNANFATHSSTSGTATVGFLGAAND